MSFILYIFLFFFFQAEDGIRDPLVTGVQTCALPISATEDHRLGGGARRGRPRQHRPSPRLLHGAGRSRRSEERRVGKECRSRGSAYDEKKKAVERGGESS